MENTIRVLVVDDEEDFRRNLVRALKLEGIEAVACDGGACALEELAARPFDVVLLDLKMPGLSGKEVLEAILSRKFAVEVIVLTGDTSVDDAVELIETGALDYQLKPYQTHMLLESVKLAAAKRRLRVPDLQAIIS